MSWEGPYWETIHISWIKRNYAVWKRMKGEIMDYNDIDNYYVPRYFWLPYKMCQLLFVMSCWLNTSLFNLMGKMEIYERDKIEKCKLNFSDECFIEKLKTHKNE